MRRTISLVCSLLVGAAFAAGADGGTHPSDHASDSALAKAPEVVRKTIEREAHGQPVRSLTSHDEHGHTVYTALIERHDSPQPLRLKVAEDGGIVWRDDLKDQARGSAAERSEGDHAAAPAAGSSSGTVPSAQRQTAKPADPEPRTGKLAIEELPDPVKRTLLRESDGRSISDIEAKKDHGRLQYRARFRDTQGKTVKIRIAPDGSLVSSK